MKQFGLGPALRARKRSCAIPLVHSFFLFRALTLYPITPDSFVSLASLFLSFSADGFERDERRGG
jgi:hypothetical protein